MEVHKVYWWKHNNKNGQYSSAKVHRLLKVEPAVTEPKGIDVEKEYKIQLGELKDLKCEIIDGE
jgi:CRISPR-associated protein Csd2